MLPVVKENARCHFGHWRVFPAYRATLHECRIRTQLRWPISLVGSQLPRGTTACQNAGVSSLENNFIYSAADFLGWALKSGWSPSVLPVGIVYTFQSPVAQALADQPDKFVENTELTVSNARVFMTTDESQPVLVACLNPGGASMVTQLEHLRLLTHEDPLCAVIVGTCGAIAGNHMVGDTLVVTSALRNDGISDSYLPPAPTVDADMALANRLGLELGGAPQTRAWTVPVPYRSTREDLVAARSSGAEVVEMEAASLFAAGLALNVPAAAIVIVSDVHRVDEPASVDWSDTLHPILVAVDAAIRAIRVS